MFLWDQLFEGTQILICVQPKKFFTASFKIQDKHKQNDSTTLHGKINGN